MPDAPRQCPWCDHPNHIVAGHINLCGVDDCPCGTTLADRTPVPPRLPDDLSELPVLDLKAFIEIGTDGWFTGMWRDFHTAVESLNLPQVRRVSYEKIEADLDAMRKRLADIFEIPEGVLDLTDEQLHRLLHPHLYEEPLTPDS